MIFVEPRPIGRGTIFGIAHKLDRGDDMYIPFGKPEAMAKVSGGAKAPSLFGSVKFYQMTNGVLVVVDIGGLPESDTGIFALHIHEGSSCQGQGFPNTGNHYNPGGNSHPSHAGDLPPLFSCDGRAFLVVLTDRFQIPQIIGRTVLIHGKPDDFISQPSGNAGEKIACGIIAAM